MCLFCSGYLESGGMFSSFVKVYSRDGLIGLYRGCAPPLIGSGLYRSVQFAVYEALYTKWNDPQQARTFFNFHYELPFTGGLQLRVIISSFLASTCRSLLESPIEYAKVARQTNQSWRVVDLYRGFPLQWARTAGVMTTYFCLIDSIRRHFPSAFSHPLGQFLSSACSATLGFWLVWPLEVLKNQIQANTTIYQIKQNQITNETINSPTIKQRIQYLTFNHGNYS